MMLVPALAPSSSALPAAGPSPAAPGPGNTTLPNGTLPNGTLPNGTLPNGTLPNGTLPNGTLPNGTLPNGSLPNRGFPNFTNVTAEAGLSSLPFSRAAWGDYDNDGYDDLMFSNGVLYHNNGGTGFSDASSLAGTRGNFRGGVWGDYNNDGRLDYYAYAGASGLDTLFRNHGDGTFADVTASAGMPRDNLPSEAAAWADFDRDGCLDLFVANGGSVLPGDNTGAPGGPNILWRNRCDGTFSNDTTAAGVEGARHSWGVVWGDFNNDQWPDAYVSNAALEPNDLWLNNKNGTFTNVGRGRGVDCDRVGGIGNRTGICGNSIGADFADINGDGNLDLFVANLASPAAVPAGADTSQLFVSRGPPAYNFGDIREAAGIRYTPNATNPTFADFDADGRQDLFITTSATDDINNLYQNQGADRFNDVTGPAGVRSANGWGSAVSDFDRDGDLDLVIGSPSGVRLFRNGGNDNAYIELALKGKNSNRAAIGTRVNVTPEGGQQQMQEIQGGDGTGSQSSMRLFFGLGRSNGSVAVEIQWPSGLGQRLTFAANGIYTVDEPEGIIDLAVTQFVAVPANPVVNSATQLTATIENVGTATPDAAELAFYRDSVSPSNQLGDTVIVGRLSGSQNFTVAVSAPSSPGPLTLIAKLQNIAPADQNAPNDQRSILVTVRAENKAPVAFLAATPAQVELGASVTFDGSNSSDDSRVSQFAFDFGDGASWLGTTPMTNHSYSQAGAFTARLTVIDDEGAPSSNEAEVDITVTLPGAQPPVAVIDSITPASPEMRGAKVTFEGHGIATDASIAEYQWESDIDGVLSMDALFTTTSLGLGNHTIHFTVRDSNGLWSSPATARFLVASSGDMSITFRDLVNDTVVHGATKVRGTATSASGALVSKVEWKVDNGNAQSAAPGGGGEWSFDLDTISYTEGSHDLTVIVTDSQNLVSTRTIHLLFSHQPVTTVGIGGPAFYAAVGGGLLGLMAILLLVRARRAGRRSRAAATRPLSPRPGAATAAAGPVRPIRKDAPRRMRAVSTESKASLGHGDAPPEGVGPVERVQ